MGVAEDRVPRGEDSSNGVTVILRRAALRPSSHYENDRVAPFELQICPLTREPFADPHRAAGPSSRVVCVRVCACVCVCVCVCVWLPAMTRRSGSVATRLALIDVLVLLCGHAALAIRWLRVRAGCDCGVD